MRRISIEYKNHGPDVVRRLEEMLTEHGGQVIEGQIRRSANGESGTLLADIPDDKIDFFINGFELTDAYLFGDPVVRLL
ncbi:hypothetical protein DES32_0855 [Methylovirgula ligni]|uniref:Uncharacterized protein n=1 Tax=Methylovirgula ligni TaxID=569860 RepID=A0A3D9Z3E5_9HYPH|nr:hypothetical protein [Methylovirgula ligni]REF89627.1 hypothetical protein DES32_0855 [Methylovirgula ligni]